MQEKFRRCTHAACGQPASSRVGAIQENGEWDANYTVLSCINHVNYFIEHRNIQFPFAEKVGVGVLDRRP